MQRNDDNAKRQESILEEVLHDKLDIREADIADLTVKPIIQEAVKALNANNITKLAIHSTKECVIQVNDIFALSKALASNTSLTVLDLSKNNFSGVSCGLLARALALNTTLRHLDLSENQRMNHVAIDALLPGLQKNTTLRELTIVGENDLLSSDVCRLLKSSPNLTALCLNIFDGFNQQFNSRLDKLYTLIKGGLLSLLANNYGLNSFGISLGGYTPELAGAIDAIITRRNGSAIHCLIQRSGEVLAMQLTKPFLTVDDLRRAFDTRINASDLKVFYQGGFRAVIHDMQVEAKYSLTECEINKFLRELKFYSECIYIRDVLLADITDANEKFEKFCEKVALLKYEHRTYGLGIYNASSIKTSAEIYYKTTTDKDFPNVKKSVDECEKKITENYQIKLQKEIKEYEERQSQYGYGEDPENAVDYSVSRWRR